MRLKSIFFIVSVIVLSSCSFSAHIGTDSSDADSTKVDTTASVKIQDTFFDTKFGASVDEVINNFANHGFSIDSTLRSDNWMPFNYDKGDTYKFGGLDWEEMNVYTTNGIFSSITFYNPFDDKATAMEVFKQIESVVSGKYKLEQVEPDDSLTYVVKRALGSNGCTLVIGCEKYQTVNNDTLYTAYLSYHDSALEDDEDSDEL